MKKIYEEYGIILPRIYLILDLVILLCGLVLMLLFPKTIAFFFCIFLLRRSTRRYFKARDKLK